MSWGLGASAINRKNDGGRGRKIACVRDQFAEKYQKRTGA